MVDLHQTEPGMAPGHPWLARSRWGIAWRAALGAIVAGLGVVLAITLFGLLGGDPVPETTLNLVWFGAPQLLVLTATAAVLGPWLRRYYPFTQALLFSGIALAAAFVLAVVIEALARVVDPSVWGAGFFLVLLFAGFPFFLTGAVGYGLAIWSVTPRGARVFWPLLAGVILLFAGCWIAAQLTAASAIAWSP
jgi:hypothetical protein